MKFLSAVFLCFLSTSQLFAQMELWAKTGGGAGDDEAEALCVDQQGNVFVTGFFKSADITLGNSSFKNKSEKGSSDVFLSKYDPEGNLLWSKTWGGELDDQPLAISTDKSGNVFVRGYFDSKNFELENVKLQNPDDDYSSFFLTKIDPSGKVVWTKGGRAFPEDHYIDDAGNIFLAGDLYKGTTAFDKTKISNPEDGFFLSKITPDGKYEWIKRGIGGRVSHISGDKEEHLYVTGTIMGKTFVIEGGKKLKNNGPELSTDFFAAKFTKNGDLAWAHTAGGPGHEEPKSQFVDQNGNLFVVLRFTSIKMNIDVEHTNEGGDDLLLIKYNKKGDIEWAKSEGGPGHEQPIYLTGDKEGNVILTGHFFSHHLTFENIVLGNTGQNDIFIVKYSTDGKVLWAKSTGSSNFDYPIGQVIDEKGNLCLIGIFNSSSDKSKVTEEFFMELYDSNGKAIWKNKAHRTDNFDFTFGETLDNSGHIFLVGYFGGHFTFGDKTYTSSGKKDLFLVKYETRK